MTTSTLAPAAPPDLAPEFQQMLDDIDERVDVVELSPGYAESLARTEWLVLRDVLLQNDVPLRVSGRPQSLLSFAA